MPIWAYSTSMGELGARAVAPVLVSIGVTLLTALYYKHRIGGITGDCFGATNRPGEIAVFSMGGYHRAFRCLQPFSSYRDASHHGRGTYTLRGGSL
jgi:Cobalamin-5-phosphate synthase